MEGGEWKWVNEKNEKNEKKKKKLSNVMGSATITSPSASPLKTSISPRNNGSVTPQPELKHKKNSEGKDETPPKPSQKSHKLTKSAYKATKKLLLLKSSKGSSTGKIESSLTENESSTPSEARNKEDRKEENKYFAEKFFKKIEEKQEEINNTRLQIESYRNQSKELREKERLLLEKLVSSQSELLVLQKKFEEFRCDLSDGSEDSDSFPYPEEKWKFDMSNFGWNGLQPLTSVKDNISEEEQ